MNENIILAAGLFLFTGVESTLDSSTALEILSKFGVIAVLWYWLRDLKKQLSTQITEFRAETGEVRKHYDKILEKKSEEHKDYMDRIEKLINDKDN
jgi:hypothetical protein